MRNIKNVNYVLEYPKITSFREKMSTFANNEELSAQIAAKKKRLKRRRNKFHVFTALFLFDKPKIKAE